MAAMGEARRRRTSGRGPVIGGMIRGPSHERNTAPCAQRWHPPCGRPLPRHRPVSPRERHSHRGSAAAGPCSWRWDVLGWPRLLKSRYESVVGTRTGGSITWIATACQKEASRPQVPDGRTSPGHKRDGIVARPPAASSSRSPSLPRPRLYVGGQGSDGLHTRGTLQPNTDVQRVSSHRVPPHALASSTAVQDSSTRHGLHHLRRVHTTASEIVDFMVHAVAYCRAKGRSCETIFDSRHQRLACRRSLSQKAAYTLALGV
jgi:hypothetical protein